MFFPYRACISLFQIPILTILICVLCVGVFIAQTQNSHAIHDAAASYCDGKLDKEFRRTLVKLAGNDDASVCVSLMLAIHSSDNTKVTIAELVKAHNKPSTINYQNNSYYEEVIGKNYLSYRISAPSNLTNKLMYPPDSWNPVRMLSAVVAHGDWGHIIGNLIFFYAFASTLEILLGPILYAGVLVMLAFGTQIAYSLTSLGQSDALPTLGLSGVVMGTLALFCYFLPAARIRCFLWLIIFFKRFSLPAWLLALWFIGFDVYQQVTGHGDTGINLIAHLSGAAFGLLIGLIFFREKRHWAQSLVQEH